MASEGENFTLDHENHSIFTSDHDRQLLLWLHRRPEDWTLSWGGAGTIYGWGHNHRGQVTIEIKARMKGERKLIM
jgi:E3 ubiquitin-protein ligase HERC2